MKIGLINIEPKIFNTAYMQLSEYFLNANCIVRLIDPEEPGDYESYDKLFCSSLFGFTNKSLIPNRTVCGGTGFDLKTKLPSEIARSQLNYYLYPKCKTSFLWFSRGCIRNCSFCVVRQKEGKIRPVKPKRLNPEGKYITVMDNNFFANIEWMKAISFLQDQEQPVDFQGIDVRVITRCQASELAGLKHRKQIKIAWDIPREQTQVIAGIKRLCEYVKPYKIMCYVLIGNSTDVNQDIIRVRVLEKLKIDPYVMCMDRRDLYQKKFQKWVNGFAYRNVAWGDFEI